MYLPALPQIGVALHTTTDRVAATLTAYFIGMATGQISWGPLLDRFGRRAPLAIGMVCFVLATLACAVAPRIDLLIGLRLIQGYSGCVAAVAALTMVRDFFPPHEGARIFSLLMLILGVSPLLAPTIGGLIADAWGWRAVFLVLAGLVGAIVAAVLCWLPPTRGPDTSAGLHPGTVVSRYRDFLRERRFATYVIAGGCSFAALFVYLPAVPMILMEHFHLGKKTFSLVFACLATGVIGGAQLNLRLQRLASPERIFAIALTVQSLCGVLLACGAWSGHLSLPPTLACCFGMLLSFGVINPSMSSLALGSIRRHIGSAAALMSFLTMIGGAMAAGVITLLHLRTFPALATVMGSTPVLGLLALAVLGRSAPTLAPASTAPAAATEPDPEATAPVAAP